MWNRIFLMTALAAVLPRLAFAQMPDHSDVIEKLNAYIQYQMEDHRIPGFSIALTEGQQTVWAAGFGDAHPDTQQPATAETVYRVASISKLFNALAIMQQVEQGKLDLDAPISEYLPDISFENPFDTPVTLRHILSHRSGIIREPPVGHYFDDTSPSVAAMARSLDGRRIVYAPGTRTKYSNAAVSLSGYLLERVIGLPFPLLLEDGVFTPLGMTQSSFLPRATLGAGLAQGYMWTYDGRTFDAPVFELGIGPAANLYTTVTDLSLFMQMLFAGGTAPDGTRILTKESLETMWTPQFTEKPEGFGLGFYVGSLDGHRQVQHSGVMYGYATRVYALPDDGLGVSAVATMDAVNPVVDRIGRYALRLLLAKQAGDPLPDFERTDPIAPHRTKKWAGRYQSAEGTHFDLVERNGNLYYDNGETQIRLQSKGSTFVADGRLGNGLTLTPKGLQLERGGTLFKRVDVPRPAPLLEKWTGLIGEYGWDHNTLYIHEKDGQLRALIEWFFDYPLIHIEDDQYQFPDHGLYMGEYVYFKRDENGRATAVEAANVTWNRRAIEPEVGQTFRITPQHPMETLRATALAASPPAEPGTFRQPDLVDVAALDSTIHLDIRYAGTNNFMGAVFYQRPHAFLQRPAAEALVRVNEALRKDGYGLLIHDAYRPWHVTKMFWDATPQGLKHFVANPKNGSRHNRGAAVDLTLYDLATGEPIAMPSGYDEFTDRAYAHYPGGTARQKWHRDYLRRAMETEGFTVYPYEWWHFDYQDWREYPILNQTFEILDTQ